MRSIVTVLTPAQTYNNFGYSKKESLGCERHPERQILKTGGGWRKKRGKEEKENKNSCSVCLKDKKKITKFNVGHEGGKISELTETVQLKIKKCSSLGCRTNYLNFIVLL